MKYARGIAIFIFGVLFPVMVLSQAYLGIQSLGDDVSYKTTVKELSEQVENASGGSWRANDYALFSLLYLEHANQKTMINKQVMKTAIINIGFAVMSIGLMLILLGIESGGIEAGAQTNELAFNFKTGSTGVAIFIVGAVMSTLGGVLKNDYQTSQIPDYSNVSFGEEYKVLLLSREAYKKCTHYGEDFETCFTQAFFQLNKGALR